MEHDMKAAVLYGAKDLRIEDRKAPLFHAEDSVIVRVRSCGICGSDIPRYYLGRARKYPLILGHEFSGEVVEFGKSVKDLKKGDHCVGVPLFPCGTCPACLTGNFSLCANYSFLGSRQDGAMQELIELPRRNIFPIGKEISFDNAAFFEVATVALHAVKLASFEEGARVAVFGSGVVGLLIAQWAKIKGAKEVVVFGRNEKTLQMSSQLGAAETVNVTDVDLKDYRDSFDCVFEASGSQAGVKASLDLVKIQRKVCLVGTYPDGMTFSSSEWWQINKKELVLTGSWMGYSRNFPGAEWIETEANLMSGKLKVDSLIYKTFNLEDTNEAFLEFKRNKVSGRIIIHPSETE